MPGSVTLTNGASILLADNASQASLNTTSALTVAGVRWSDLIQDITDAGVALNVGACATVGLLLVALLSGDAGGVVTFYLDAPCTVPITGACAQQTTALQLLNPVGTIYAKTNAGKTVQARVLAVEQ